MTPLTTCVVNVLLQAQHEHRAVKIYLQDSASPLNSVILGFNFFQREILLDGIVERTSQSLIRSMKGRPFWLQIRDKNRFLRVECLVDTAKFDLFTLTILRWEFSNNQRWQPRLHFDTRQGPSVRMESKNVLPVDATIKNLSAQGALIEVYGADLRQSFGSRSDLNLALKFNELFELPLKAEVKQFKFKREPSCHSSFRVMFVEQTTLATKQIESFIEAFQLETLAYQSSVANLLDAIA